MVRLLPVLGSQSCLYDPKTQSCSYVTAEMRKAHREAQKKIQKLPSIKSLKKKDPWDLTDAEYDLIQLHDENRREKARLRPKKKKPTKPKKDKPTKPKKPKKTVPCFTWKNSKTCQARNCSWSNNKCYPPNMTDALKMSRYDVLRIIHDAKVSKKRRKYQGPWMDLLSGYKRDAVKQWLAEKKRKAQQKKWKAQGKKPLSNRKAASARTTKAIAAWGARIQQRAQRERDLA